MDYRFTAALIILLCLMAMFLEPGYQVRWQEKPTQLWLRCLVQS